MKQVSASDFEEQILRSEKICLVYFKSRHCPMCSNLEVVMEDLFKSYFTRIKFCSVDVLDEVKLADLFDIDGVPAVFLFKGGDGQEVEYPEAPDPFSGYSMRYLMEHLDRALKDE